jgi:hypothetical protein
MAIYQGSSCRQLGATLQELMKPFDLGHRPLRGEISVKGLFMSVAQEQLENKEDHA